MDWGILLTTSKPDHLTEREVLKASVEFAVTAERQGFDSAWVLEHHFTPYGLCPDTLALAGFLLGQTTRLKIGTAVLVAPLLHPVRIAETAALLDQLGDSRLLLGLGRGGFRTDFQVLGADPAVSQEALRECTDILRAAWTQDKAEGTGAVYTFPPVPIIPKPLAPAGPPIYIAGESPSTVEWAAAQGFPLLLTQGVNDEEVRSRMELYNDAADAAGHDPDEIPHALVCVAHIADGREEAKSEVLSHLRWWIEEGQQAGFTVEDLRRLPTYQFHLRRMEQAVLEGQESASDFVESWLDNNPVGTPEQCVERLEIAIEASGAHHVILGVEGAAGDRERTLRNIERFATEVIPKVSVKTA